MTLDRDAWHLFGYGIGQAEIIGLGIGIAAVLVVGYRLFTRDRRYPDG